MYRTWQYETHCCGLWCLFASQKLDYCCKSKKKEECLSPAMRVKVTVVFVIGVAGKLLTPSITTCNLIVIFVKRIEPFINLYMRYI